MTENHDRRHALRQIFNAKHTMKTKYASIFVGTGLSVSVVLFGPSAAAQCVPAPAGIVGWWPGDGNTSDIVAGNNGTLENGATFAPGMVGQAFSLTNAFVVVSNRPSLNLTGSLSLEFWARPSSISGRGAVLDMAQEGTVNENYSAVNVNGMLVFQYYNGGWQWATAPNFFAAGTWVHGVVTYQAGNVFIYRNGAQVAQTNGLPPLLTNSANALAIGRYQVGSTGYFIGLIDEVAIYSRALTPTEVAAHYAADGAGMCKIQILVPPGDQVVACGSNATFSVVATNASLYQWQFNGTNIAGATNASLVVTNARSPQAGVYTVVVGDPAGYHLNASATLAFSFLELHMYAGVTIKGRVGGGYLVEYTDSLTPPVQWTVITNIVSLPVTPYIYIDFDSVAQPKRFYRVVSPDCP